MSTALKKHLFDAYKGFSDKRIKNLNKGNTFIIDDRSPKDIDSKGGLYSLELLQLVQAIFATERCFPPLACVWLLGK